MSMCESSRYSRQKKQMTAFSLGARLPLGANGRLALSLPQSYCLNPLCSPTAPSSEGAEAAPPQSTEFAKVRAAVKPAAGGLPSSVMLRRCAAPRHLPRQGKVIRRWRFAQICRGSTLLSECARTAGTHSFFMCPKGALHVPKARFMRHSVLHLRSKKIPPFDKSKDGNKSRGTTFVGNAQSSSCPVTAASRPILLAPGRFPSAAWE